MEMDETKSSRTFPLSVDFRFPSQVTTESIVPCQNELIIPKLLLGYSSLERASLE
ncbi:unnamed protein product [Dovyalis caffra]|uniref:Uncharacterized protein n=1 Tax=Dovyalis caffra TaxID=77055 RepID=A0AAV1SAH4_9ROSI|nr:unnamed protein product [Dovyalis caffra]